MSPSQSEQEVRAWLILVHTPGIGAITASQLLERFGSVQAVVAASREQLMQCGIKKRALDYLSSPDDMQLERAMQWLAGPDHHLLTLDNPRYPILLKEIDSPPLALFVHGCLELLTTPQLAIVGSRNPSTSGRETSRDFARYLAGSGFTITSGLATGIDGAAHSGALEQGHTLAVAGTGLDRVYPARHRDLAHRIAAEGALVSEFPPGTAPHPGNFPRRNRIISGLSLGTLVVEAALKSGSLVTARLAMEQGREVFAIPGSIHNPLARGCHRLIREGAKLVETASDIVEELGALLGSLPVKPVPEPASAPPTHQLDDDYRALLQAMGHDPVPIDQLIQRTGLTADAVSSMLLMLELDGVISSAPGGRYCRTGHDSADAVPPEDMN